MGADMHHYMEFMAECDRLKDLFLMEGTEDAENKDTAKDAENATEDDGEAKDTDGDGEGTDDAEGGEGSEDDGGLGDLSDLDMDSDLGDLTGDDTLEPSAEEVNSEEQPGAVNPGTLYQELTQSDDNIYDRTAKAALEKFPNGKCVVKDMLPIIAIGIKSYMKNKNYAPLPKIDMKKLVYRIAHDIHDRLASKKKATGTNSQKADMQSVRFDRVSTVLTEGWKDWMMAAAIAGAPMAGHAATAESAPMNTHQGTSKIITNNRSMDVDSREMVNTKENYGGKVKADQKGSGGKQVGRTSTPAKMGGGSSEVPTVSDYSIVSFDSGTTYQVTPEQLKKMQAVGNVPAKYQVLDKNAPAGQGKAKSATQAAAKAQAKTQAKSPANGGRNSCRVDAERCGCSPNDGEDIDWKGIIHKGAHGATDAALTVGGTAIDVAKKVPGALSKFGGFLKRTYNSNKAEIEKEHDGMIAERGR